jgi:hypothetical protein
VISSDGLPCGLDGAPRLDDPSTIGLVLFVSPLLFFFAFALVFASFSSLTLFIWPPLVSFYAPCAFKASSFLCASYDFRASFSFVLS